MPYLQPKDALKKLDRKKRGRQIEKDAENVNAKRMHKLLKNDLDLQAKAKNCCVPKAVKTIATLFFIVAGLLSVEAQQVQRLFPCKDNAGNAVPGCLAVTLDSGQYAEVIRDTSFCSGDTLFSEYVAANSFLNITEGDLVFTDTIYNSCSGADEQQLSLDSTLTSYQLTIENGNTVTWTKSVGSTDDQNISGSNLTGTDLFIGIEDGNGETVDLSSLQDGTGTDDQTLSIDGADNLIIEDGNQVSLTPYLDNTDAQTLSHSIGTAGDDEITISNGNTITIDDDVNDADADPNNEIQDLLANSNLVNGAVLDISDGGASVDLIENNGLEIGIDVIGQIDFGILQDSIDAWSDTGTDDQNISGSNLTGTDLFIGIENGTGETVDLSSLQDGTGTDDQNISGSSFNSTNGNLTIGIEDGNNQTFSLDGRYLQSETDDQTLTWNSTNGQLTIETGNTVDLDGRYLQSFTETDPIYSGDPASGITNGDITNWDAAYSWGDHSLAGYLTSETDDQNISGSGLAGTILTIGIENGLNETVDLASLQDGTGTDDQTLTFSSVTGNLTIEDGNTVNMDSRYLQSIYIDTNPTAFGRLELSGVLADVELYGKNGILISDSTNQSLKFEIHQDSLDSWSSGGGTDDQTLSEAAGDSISIENGNTVSIADGDADDTNEIQDVSVSTLGNGDVRLGITPISLSRNMDFRAGDGITLDVVTPGDVMEITADPLDTIYINITHTFWHDTITQTYSDDYFVVPPSMDGWRIKEQSLSTWGNADGNVLAGYAVQLAVGGENANDVTITNGTKQASESFSFGQTLSEGDLIRVKSNTTTSDTEGLSMTLMIAEP